MTLEAFRDAWNRANDEPSFKPYSIAVRVYCSRCKSGSGKLLGQVYRHPELGHVYYATSSAWFDRSNAFDEDPDSFLEWKRETGGRENAEGWVLDLLDWPPAEHFHDQGGLSLPDRNCSTKSAANCPRHGTEILDRSKLIDLARRTRHGKPAVFTIHTTTNV